MKLLMLLLAKLFLWLWFLRISKELLGDNYGWVVFLMTRSLMLKGTLITWRMWPLLLTGWPNNFGKAEKNSVFQIVRIKYLFTLSSSFNILTSKWLFTSSKKTKTIVISLIQSVFKSMNQVKNSSKKLKSHILNMKNISAVLRNLFNQKMLLNRFLRKNQQEWVLFLILINPFFQFCLQLI